MKVISSIVFWTVAFSQVWLTTGCGSVESELMSSNDEQTELPFWPTSKSGDPQLNTSHQLHAYYLAAQTRLLPANYFRDLISANAAVDVKYGDWPRYQPRRSGGTIYVPSFNKEFSAWNTSDWSAFYNELFHAWWGNVFSKSSKYQSERNQILTNERRTHYRRANPNDPLLAQEEAYSETVGTLMIYMHPKYNPNLPGQRGYMTLTEYRYDQGRTVSPVSHSEQPGYTPEAESTYPNQAEYALMFGLLTDVQPPVL